MSGFLKPDWYIFSVGSLTALWLLGYGCCSCSIFYSVALLSFIRFVYLKLDADFYVSFFDKFWKSRESLNGKVVWITGASTGIGKACAQHLSQAGCKLIISARSLEKLRDVKKECTKLGNLKPEDILVLPFDMTDYTAHEPSFKTVLNHFGKIDILLSNAGSTQRAQWEEIETSVDREIFDLNVFSLVSLARIVTKYFIEEGAGHHAVVSSVVGKMGAPGSSSYSATKFALHGYFETLRAEYGSKGINVTMLNIGPVASNLMALSFRARTGERGLPPRSSELMEAERCAQLVSVSIANRLSEAWISTQPALLFMQLYAIFPTLFRYSMSWIDFGKLAQKARDGTP